MSTIIGNAVIVGGGDIKISQVLDENSWGVIKLVSSLGAGANYWAVGDCKQITMNGKVSDGLTLTNYTAWVFIIGFNHNAEREGNGIAFQGFKTAQTGGTDICLTDSGYKRGKTSGTWFNMNNSQTNAGGWSSSHMRSAVMPLIKAAFPADLQAVIKTSTIYTDNTGGSSGNVVPTATQDDVFLLAEYEMFGASKYATTQEANYLKQYAYYAAGNSKLKYKHNATGTAADWWGRSPYFTSSDRFCFVSSDGGAVCYYAYYSYGVAPAFKI